MKNMDDTSSKEDFDVPIAKSKGVEVKEHAKVIPKKSKYSKELKGKQTLQSSKKYEVKLLRKYTNEIQQVRREEPTRRSTELMSFGSTFFTPAKRNNPQDPIFINEDEEDTLNLTPLQICVPYSKEQSKTTIQEDDDASFKGDDIEETELEGIFFEGNF